MEISEKKNVRLVMLAAAYYWAFDRESNSEMETAGAYDKNSEGEGIISRYAPIM